MDWPKLEHRESSAQYLKCCSWVQRDMGPPSSKIALRLLNCVKGPDSRPQTSSSTMVQTHRNYPTIVLSIRSKRPPTASSITRRSQPQPQATPQRGRLSCLDSRILCDRKATSKVPNDRYRCSRGLCRIRRRPYVCASLVCNVMVPVRLQVTATWVTACYSHTSCIKSETSRCLLPITNHLRICVFGDDRFQLILLYQLYKATTTSILHRPAHQLPRLTPRSKRLLS